MAQHLLELLLVAVVAAVIGLKLAKDEVELEISGLDRPADILKDFFDCRWLCKLILLITTELLLIETILIWLAVVCLILIETLTVVLAVSPLLFVLVFVEELLYIDGAADALTWNLVGNAQVVCIVFVQ